MSPAEAFRVVTIGLASQRWQKSCEYASSGRLVCRLRAGGNKCAIGWLIPDEVYDPGMEEGDVEWPLPDVPQSLLDDMRKAHDHSFSARDMWGCFRRIARARQFSFDFPAPITEG